MPSPLQILIVDDNEADRRTICKALHARHDTAQVQEAVTCAEAQAALTSGAFDCAFVDFDLPDGDGLDCVSDIRSHGNVTPIVVLFPQGSEEAAAETMRAGATDYLPKSEITSRVLDRCLRGAMRYQHAQEEVRRAQEGLHLRDHVIAAASQGIVIADPNLKDCPIIYVNPAFSRLTGYSEAEAIGRNCRFLQGPETDPNQVRIVREALAEGRPCHVILKNYRKDGTSFWNELVISPVRDSGGRLTHFIGVQIDVSQRREDEDALRAAHARQQNLLRDMFASVTEGKLILCADTQELPTPLETVEHPISLDASTGGIRTLRRQTLAACLATGMAEERRFDFETAVGEAAMNAVVHALTGIGRVSYNPGGMVQIRIDDRGRGIAVENLPKATLKRGYSSAGTMGHGFKMMLQTADRVFLLTSPAGTTVILEQEREPPPPRW